MKNLIITLAVSIATIIHINAQQLPIFAQYNEYQGFINPSAVNTDYTLNGFANSFGVSARRQWINIPSSPETYIAKGEFIHESSSAVSMMYGGYLINDQTGDISTTGAYGKIAGIFSGRNSPQEGGFSLGLMGGLVQYKVDIQSLYERHGDDPLIAEQSADNVIRPDLGVGLSYYKQFTSGLFEDDFVVVGFSVPQVLGLSLEYGEEANNFYINRIQHFYFTGSFIKVISDETYLELSTWIRQVKNVPTSFDIVCRYRFADFMWFGVGASNAATAHVEFGLYLGESIGLRDNAFKVGLSFSPSLTNYGTFYGRTVELNIAYLRF